MTPASAPRTAAGHSPHDDWRCECGHPYLLSHEQRPAAPTVTPGLREALYDVLLNFGYDFPYEVPDRIVKEVMARLASIPRRR